MMKKHKRPAWRIRLTIFAAVLGLILTMLGGCAKEKPEQTAPGGETSAPESTAPATETTAAPTTEPTTGPATEATTEPATEPTTEPVTEPSTEPATEPSTEPSQTPGGNSTPGGTTGYNPGGSSSQEQPKEEFLPPEPGTAGNPYVEELAAVPDGFNTVSIPAGGSICYEVFASDPLVLTLEAPDAWILHKDVTYVPDENGVISLTLTPVAPEAPETEEEENGVAEEADPQPEDWFVILPFAVGSSAAEDKTFALSFTETLGGVTNPQILDALGAVTVLLSENDRNGYHYQWAAAIDDRVTFAMDSVAPDNVGVDLLVTLGEQVFSLGSDGVDNGQGVELAVDVLAGDVLTIQVIAAADEAGNYPAAEVTFRAASAFAPGSEKNPVKTTVDQIPMEFTTVAVPSGEGCEVWYELTGAGGCVLTVVDKDAYILYGENRYEADENGVVTVTFTDGAGRVPVLFRVGNLGEEKTFPVSLAYPEGGTMAPIVIEDIAVIEAVTGPGGSVCYSWTANETGVLQIETEPGDFDVEVNNVTAGSYKSLSADGVRSDMGICIRNYVRQGDTVQILVTAGNGGEGFETVLCGYVLGTGENPLFVTDSELSLPVAGGSEVVLNAYCYEHTMTVSSDSAYIIFNGQRYEPTNGQVSLTFPVNTETMGRPTPLAIIVGNGSEAVQTYEIRIQAPLGSAMNPEEIGDFSQLPVEIPEGDSDGAWVYSWTAERTGILHVSIYNAPDDVEFDISLYNPATGVYMNFSEDGVRGDMGDYVQTYVRAGDVLDITVSVAGSPGDNNIMEYPDFRCELSGYMVGTEDSPMFLGEQSFVLPLASASGIPVMAYCYEMTMTVTGEHAYVIYEGIRYDPVEGVITLVFPENPVTVGRPQPLQFTIGNDGEYAVKLPVTMEEPLGSRGNPEELEIPCEKTVELEEGNSDGWYFKWIPAEAGTVTFRITEVTEKTQGDIVLTNNTTGAQNTLTGADGDTVSVSVAPGDELLIQIVAVPNEADWSYPASQITAVGSFTPNE